MQAAVYGMYKSGVVELDEKPVGTQDGNRVMVVFLDKSRQKNEISLEASVNEMCGIFAGMVPFSASDDFARNKQK